MVLLFFQCFCVVGLVHFSSFYLFAVRYASLFRGPHLKTFLLLDHKILKDVWSTRTSSHFLTCLCVHWMCFSHKINDGGFVRNERKERNIWKNIEDIMFSKSTMRATFLSSFMISNFQVFRRLVETCWKVIIVRRHFLQEIILADFSKRASRIEKFKISGIQCRIVSNLWLEQRFLTLVWSNP